MNPLSRHLSLNPEPLSELKPMMKNEHVTEKDVNKQDRIVAGDIRGNSSSGTAVFDWAGLLYRLMGDEELAEEIVGDFLNQIPFNMDALRQSLDKKEGLMIKKEAHIIKGAAGNVGALVLQEIAGKIEQAGESGKMARAQLYFTEFNTQLKALKDELNRLFH